MQWEKEQREYNAICTSRWASRQLDYWFELKLSRPMGDETCAARAGVINVILTLASAPINSRVSGYGSGVLDARQFD
jgi:hypothetical protein